MFKKKLLSQLLLAFLYAVFVFLLGRNFRPEFIFFVIGVSIGIFLLYLDPLASAYLTSPNLPFSQELKSLVNQKHYKEALITSFNRHLSHEEPILHSALFQIALTILGLYVVTSSGSLFGSGMVMGMALHLIKDEIDKSKDHEGLNKMLFWNIHRQVSDKEQKIYLGTVFALFAIETILFI